MLEYEISGPPEAPALVFINGLGGVKEAWFYQVRHFRQRRRILVFDNRGAGGSESVDAPTTIADFSDDLVGLMDQVGLAKATLVGISFGGRVAQQVALAHPSRVASLVLVGTACGPSQGGAAHEVLRRAEELDEQGWLEQLVPVLFGPRYVREESRRLQVFARSRTNRARDAVGHLRQWEAYESFDACDRLGEIRAPTLVIHGEDDALSPLSNARELAENIPGARLEVMPAVGHSPNVEDPVSFNAVLEHFLQD